MAIVVCQNDKCSNTYISTDSRFQPYRLTHCVYKCLVCRDNFTLCEDCFIAHTHPGHIMIYLNDSELVKCYNCIEDVTSKHQDDIHDVQCCRCYDRIRGIRIVIQDKIFGQLQMDFKCFGNLANSGKLLASIDIQCLGMTPQKIEDMAIIGGGRFGIVIKGRSGTTLVASKIIKTALNPREFFTAEINAYRSLRSNNILRLYNSSAECFRLVFEYMENGSLNNLFSNTTLPKLDAVGLLNIACDVLHGLSYLHKLRWVHTDLRPENILLDGNMRAKLGDLGLATRNLKYISPGFPPFVCAQWVYDPEVWWEIDIQSAGFTLNFMFKGKNDVTETNRGVIRAWPAPPISSLIELCMVRSTTSAQLLDWLKSYRNQLAFKSCILEINKKINS